MLNKIQKTRILAEVLENVVSDFSWRMDNAQENAESYAKKHDDPDYSWDSYDDRELAEREYKVKCYETIISHLEKLV